MTAETPINLKIIRKKVPILILISDCNLATKLGYEKTNLYLSLHP